MAGKTYKTRGIVLRKTKLGEKDLIVSLLDESGALLKGVAKGARRPGSALAAKLELFSIVNLECAQGRSLDIITGATFYEKRNALMQEVEHIACASALAELVCSIAQEDLPHPQMFDMVAAALAGIESPSTDKPLALTLSAMLKTLAYAGFRPSFTSCIACAQPLDSNTEMVRFSLVEGGVVCAACTSLATSSDALLIPFAQLQWADVLMRSRFSEVSSMQPDGQTLSAILHLIQQWTRVHVGKSLKSIDFLLCTEAF